MVIDFDTIVVGAGVIGLAIARQLAMVGQSVLVLEKANRAGTETSSRNSEVIHAGIYYPNGSLKARVCVEGRELLYDFCEAHGVETKKLGKLIVATTAEEEEKLHFMATLAKANGVHNLQWLSEYDVAALEPEVRCTGALFSPSTGIIDAAAFMLALQGDAEAHGAVFAFNTSFQMASKQTNVFTVTATDISGDLTQLTSRVLVNCAGHGAHDVASNIEGYPIDRSPPHYLAKGSYCSVSGKSPFKHLVYPVPVSGALGIHATVDLSGSLRFGPDIEWVDTVDYTLRPGLSEKFTTAVQAYWPGVTERLVAPSYCGIRPKIHSSLESFADFMIQRRDEHRINGLINLFGIESPGLTASLSIAQLVGREC